MLGIMSRSVLCISGKRFTGKDTLAGLMVAAAGRRGLALDTYAFAGESKRMFAAEHPEVDLARFGERDYKEQWRPALTRFTVDALARDPLVFCCAVMERIEASASFALITDLRLRIESDHLGKRAHAIRVARSDANRAASGWVYDEAQDTHFTETELDDPARWSELVTNDGTLAELASHADALVSRLLR